MALSLEVYSELYRDARCLPWVTGQPQPAVVALAAEAELLAPVLDVGCGAGENAVYLAGLGLEVTAIDVVPAAVELARHKADAACVGLRAFSGDVLAMARQSSESFGTILDSCCFHAMDRSDAFEYARSIHRLLRPGGALHVIAISDVETAISGPVGWSARALQNAFSWPLQMRSVKPCLYLTTTAPAGRKAWLASFRHGDA